MKALVVNAEWRPKKNYSIGEEEILKKRAIIGSQVWKNTTFEIKDIPTPNPNSDEILIKVKSCGICGSDTHLYETDEEGYIIFSGLTKLPCIIGHEFSGIVEKAGSNVREFKKGDKVAVESIMWCGRCQSCRSGFPNQCKYIELMGLSADGAFAEYVTVSERYCWKINDLMHVYPEEDVFDIGALIEPVGCAYNGIFVVGGGFNPGAIVVVYGTGPIGLGAVALSRIAGASQIIAFDVIDERVKIAKDMGADHVFNINKLDGWSPADKVVELTKGGGADIQVEAAGAANKTIPEMERSMAINGKIIYLGRAATSATMHLDTLVSGASKIIGARGHSGYGIFPSIIKLIAAGKLNLGKMITARYPFESVLDAIKASSKRSDAKILVKM
ncbi:MAG: alcohol dehydrogenase catalytic domain-containing protein [Planctomycetes bacterium]|uniref:scyllo-inosose 3-dehydrogenase n=1 Tax=Candidatus Wunengus sp. YC65 TaxID=3367701 RepID=UPI001D1D0BF0|nr:alcohol dehydrogenase catalytic domain-containing protein [Planctomycetota bacterium]